MAATSMTIKPAPATVPVGSLTLGRLLLLCGVLASLLYATMNVLLPVQWPGYSLATRVVSELSAIGAPTRAAWIPFGVAYGVLMTAFGFGIWAAARGSRSVRIMAVVMIIYGAIGLAPWPPMHQREVLAAGGGSLTDTLHIVWSGVSVSLMFVAMAFGAAAFGKAFRVYTIVSMVALIMFGILTAIDSPAMSANLPTPWIGVWERISLGVFLLWVVVLAFRLSEPRPRGPSWRESAPLTPSP